MFDDASLDTYMDKILKEEAPKVAGSLDALSKVLLLENGLDQKMAQLIYLGIAIAAEDSSAVAFHVGTAKRLGASRQEVKNTALLALTTSGVSVAMNALALSLDAYDIE